MALYYIENSHVKYILYFLFLESLYSKNLRRQEMAKNEERKIVRKTHSVFYFFSILTICKLWDLFLNTPGFSLKFF